MNSNTYLTSITNYSTIMKWILLTIGLSLSSLAFNQQNKGEKLIYEDEKILFSYTTTEACNSSSTVTYVLKIQNKQSVPIQLMYKIKPEFNGKCFNCFNTLDPSLQEPLQLPANGIIVGNCESKEFGLQFSFAKNVPLSSISITNLVIR